MGHHSVLVTRSDGKYSAIGNQCTHYGAPLSKGKLMNEFEYIERDVHTQYSQQTHLQSVYSHFQLELFVVIHRDITASWK